jgi:DNA-binding transcriptional ArsR family regulator
VRLPGAALEKVREALDGTSASLYYTDRLFNKMVNNSTSGDRLNGLLLALADPTRRAILARLAGGAKNVGELAEPFAMSLPAVSKHLKVLERAGLIARGRDAQRRPCELDAAPLREVADWLEAYRAFWDSSFDRLGTYLHTLQKDALDD